MKRGSGYWKFNTLLLSDPVFVDHITEFFEDFRTQTHKFSNKADFWECAKLNFKRIAIFHSTKRARNRKNERDQLLDQIEQERSRLPQNKVRIKDLRAQLRVVDTQAAKKIFIQTHAKYLEEGERPTKFFFAAQKFQEKANCILQLNVVDSHGHTKEVFDQAELRTEIADFYEKLFTKQPNLDKDLQEFFLSNIKRKLPETKKAELDRKFTRKELRDATFQSKLGTSPGWDGLPYEFYRFFWDLLKDAFYEMQDCCLNDICHLTNTQRKSIVTLLFKGGVAENILNWRPVSLLCCDYKILAKAIANRLRNVLGIVAHEDQTCAVPGRSIFSNLYLTRDIIQYTEQKRIKGYIINIDQEKAFDRVDREFLFDVLERMNFGPNFIKWIRAIYRDSETSVLVNGYMTKFFLTTRGLRQGCPTSQELYDLFSEILAEAVRSDHVLTGIPIPWGVFALISLYADDFAFFLRTLLECQRLFQLLHLFELATGAKIKRDKTKGICLGGSTPFQDPDVHVEWVGHTGLKSLGIYFFPDQLQTINFNWSVIKQRLINFTERTKNRKLSFRGKVLNLNMCGMGQFWHLATVIPPPDWIRPSLEHIIFKYLWDYSWTEQISRKTLYLPKDKGGLGLLNPKVQSTALRTKFFTMVTDKDETTKWIYLARYWVGFPLGGLHPDWTFLRNNRYPKMIRPTGVYPNWYVDCLKFLQETPDLDKLVWTAATIRAEIISRQKHIPTAHSGWVSLGKADTDWNKAWKGPYGTYATGFQQDIHFKFLHQALYTNKLVNRFRTGQSKFCDFCLSQGRETAEDIFHLFFKCRLADGLWLRLNPLLQLLLGSGSIRRVQFLFNVFPQGTPFTVKKLLLSLVQIICQQVWINRNGFKHSQFYDLDRSKRKIFIMIKNMITANFNRCYRENRLSRFRKLFCVNPRFCRLDAQGSLDFPFFHLL